MSEFKMPSLGSDMESATLVVWNVKVGDSVKNGDVIAEVETSKGVIEIEVFQDGIIEELLVEEGTECEVGTPLAVITDSKEQSETNLEIKDETKVLEKNIEEKELSTTTKISPAAKKKAKELGIDISSIIKEDGKAIQLEDIEKLAKENEPSKEKKGIKETSMREAIAKAMTTSNKEIPHYYLSTTIKVSDCLDWLEKINKELPIAQRILPAALFIKACVEVLKEVPQLNGFYKDNKHEKIQKINPGIAIALRKEGLFTPAILDASTLNLNQTMEKLGDLIQRSRNGKLKNSELTEQTITITNLGDLGVEEVFGVIYPPQVAIIGLGKVYEKPCVEDKNIVIKKVLKVTISGDHRATDGRTGALFLEKLDKVLQNPQELL